MIWIGVAAAIVLIVPNVLFGIRTDHGSSFYSYWLSGRVLFAQGGNPYGDELFEQVRSRFPGNPNISGFTLPLYAILPVLPFAFINNFKAALIMWRLLLEAALIFSGLRMIRAFRLQNSLTPAGVCAALLLLNYYSFAALVEGDIAILAVAFFMIGLAALQDGEVELCGIMFAFATIKSSLTLLPVVWVCLWCISHRGGGIIVAWTAMVFALLFMIALLFRTDWFILYLRSMVYYLKYLNPMNLSNLIERWQPELGGRIGWAISGVMILLMIIEWVANARKDVNALEWVTAMTISAGFLVGIPNLGKNLFFLWVPVIYAVDKMQLRWERKGNIYSLILMTGFFLIPWIMQLFVFKNWQDPVSLMNVFAPFLLTFLLYWNRWWIIDTFVDKY